MQNIDFMQQEFLQQNVVGSDIESPRGSSLRRGGQFVRHNNLQRRIQGIDKEVIQSYERYVLANFRFRDEGPEAIVKEQQSAIESLIPGTKYYFHLYFIDLSKKKTFAELTEKETQLYQKFESKFCQTEEFIEVETAFKVVQKLEALPKKVDENTSNEDIESYLNIIDFIDKQINSPVHERDAFKPPYMSAQAQQDGHSSQSEDEEAASKLETLDQSKFFNKANLIEDAHQRIRDHCKNIKYKNDHKVNLNENIQSLNLEKYHQVFNEIDWTLCYPEFVYGQALKLAYHSNHFNTQRLQLFEMTSDKFLDQICEYFKRRFNFQNEAKEKKERKFQIDEQFFNAMTMEQMDKINAKLRQVDIDIKQSKAYVQAYFSKQFSDELSIDYQEHLSNEEKFKSLESMYQYAKAQSLHQGLVSSLLQQMLQMSLKLDMFREDLFKEYIERPTEVNHQLKKVEVYKKNSKQSHRLQNWNQKCLNNVQVQEFNKPVESSYQSSSTELIPKYLKLICTKNNGTFPEVYNDHFRSEYLRDIEKQVKVYLTESGLIDLGDDFSPDDYKRIQDQVIIRFKETNKEQFKVEEAVKIILELKNIPELVIKVFEFNTETYYRKTMKPLDTSIDLQGLEPSFMKKETEIFKDVSKNKIITHEFEFGELKDKIGTFIIEFQGNGKLSRAIIKKGSLSLIHKTTNGGHIAYIIDENRKICKSDDGKTGVLVDDKFYPTNVQKNGAIFIPYTKESQSKHQNLIMITDGFSQLGQFQRDTEQYNLEAFIHLNNESVIVGQKTKLFVRPKLTLNNRVTSMKYLKNCLFEMKITDHDGKQINHSVKDAKMKDKDEFIFEFMVPSDTKQIAVNISGQVQNHSKNKLEYLTVPEYTLTFKSHKSDHALHELYLKQVGEDYYIYCLGKNGEPLSNGKMSLKLTHKDFENAAQTSLNLDKTGRVCMGPLKGITSLKASVQTQTGSGNSRSSIEESWNIMNEQDQWTRPSEINIIHGETVEIPINYDGAMELGTYQVSLKKFLGDQVLQDLSSYIKIAKSRMQTYHQILLENLEVGFYILKLNITASDRQFITINVRQGTYWEGSFILQKNCLREYTAPSQTLRIETTTAKPVENENKHRLSIQLDNFSDSSRVHLFATHFLANHTGSVKQLMDRYCESSISGVKFNFAKWSNHFSDGKAVADEILYVLNRKQQAAKMGNLLDTPSLLMRKQYVRDTHTVQEKLSAGEKFAKVELQQMAPMMQKLQSRGGPPPGAPPRFAQSAQPMALKSMAKRKMKKVARRGSFGSDDGSMASPENSQIKDFQNFLKNIPHQLFNLKPNEQGTVEVTIPDLNSFSNLFIVACDEKSVAQRQIAVPALLQAQKKEDVEKLAETSCIERKDLRQNQTMPVTQEDGSIQGGLIQTRQTLSLAKNEEVHLKDITSSKYQILADLQQVRQVMALTLGNYKEKLVDQVLLNWHTFDENTKLGHFIDYACHEMNYFLSRKDRDFFQKHVISYIANKMEKSLVDHYILARHAGDEPGKREILRVLNFAPAFNKLNPFETCLVLEFSLSHGSADHQEKARQLAQNMIDSLKHELSAIQNSSNEQRAKAMLFDSILDMENDQKPDISQMMKELEEKRRHAEMESFAVEEDIVMESAMMMDMDLMVMDERRASSDEDEEEELSEADEFGFGGGGGGGGRGGRMMESRGRRGGGRGGGGGGGGPPRARGRAAFGSGSAYNNAMPVLRSAMAPPPMQQQMMTRNIAPPQRLMNQANDLFNMDDPFSDLYGEEKKFGLVQFEDLEATKEYRETHYQNTNNPDEFQHKFRGSGVSSLKFFSEYLDNLLKNDKTGELKPFITASFSNLTQEEVIIALGMLDLPISISSMGQYPHQFESDQKRGIIIKAGCETIIYKKEIKEGNVSLKKDMIITHKYKSETDPKVTRDDEDEEELKFFVINHIYKCEIVVTNLTPKNKKVTLLYQVPNGSLPIMDSKYIDTSNVQLSPFQTQTINFKFYFPEPGAFEHYPTNASLDDIITAISETKKLDVKKKHIITKVNTFKDLMMLTRTDNEKKQKILKLLNEDFDLIRDRNYGFNWDDIAFLTDQDKDFYLQVQEIYQKHTNKNLSLKMKHVKDIMKDAAYSKERANMMECVKVEKYHNKPHFNIFSYIFKPLCSPLIDVTSQDLFDKRFCHLEYYPIVNTRVFSFGKQKSGGDSNAKADQDSKEIINTEFKETYQTYMLLLMHQDFLKDDGTDKTKRDLKLRLVYYLLMQDRVKEAYLIFKQLIDRSDQDSGSALSTQASQIVDNQPQDKSSQVAIDYMRAYFDFQIPQDDNFKTAREIVAKYKSGQQDKFRFWNFFKKIELQLKEFDEEDKSTDTTDLGEKEKEQVEKEKKKNLIPNIHSVDTDDQTGTITIESSNVGSFDVKYYLIDAEILFSRSPFVKNEAETFSFVKPFTEKTVQAAAAGENTKVDLPPSLNHKNVIIEIKSNEIQRFVQHYSCDLNVHLQEQIGEMRVFQTSRKKALASVYIKVFVQTKDGKSVFFKDGFTDIRGKFEYAKASASSSLKTSDFKQFAIFVSHDELGSMIKTVDASKLKSEGQIVKI